MIARPATLEQRMRELGIPGASIAVIAEGKVAWARAYGVRDTVEKTLVNLGTLFQAGSISKPIAALGALRLAKEGKLTLDGDVNAKLKTWRVPQNEFTKDEKVPRVQQFVDLSRYVGSVLRRDLFPNARAAMLEVLPSEHYFREYAQAVPADKPEWDIYLSFSADAVWGDRVPRPDRWIRQTALFPNGEGQQISLMWLDSYRSMPAEGDLVKTMSRLLP